MHRAKNKRKFTFLSNIRGGTFLHVAQLFAVVLLASMSDKISADEPSPFLPKKMD
jgi:hypothetical protein